MQPQAPSGPRRVALVTGGGGGIGSAICDELAKQGMAVAVVDIDGQRAAATATAISQHGTDVIWVGMDITEQISVDRGVDDITQRLGPIDVLVNNAGWDELLPFVQTEENFWRRVVDINLLGPIRLTKAVLPSMMERRWGRIVNISSDAGRVGSSLEAVYSGAKGGVIAFGKTIARESVKHGVTVNTVCPGPTATPLLDQIISQAEDAAKVIGGLTRAVPMGRLGQPHDIAPAVAFFASDAAGYITGQTLSVSGGLTMS